MQRFLSLLVLFAFVCAALVGCGGGPGSTGDAGSVALSSSGGSPSTTSPLGTRAAAQGKVDVIITFKSQPGAAEEALIGKLGGQRRFTYRIVPAVAASLPEAALSALSKNPNVASIDPDAEITAGQSTDPEPANSWGVSKIGALSVHAGNTGNGVAVAVLDSGALYSHTDLVGRFDPALRGKDFVNNDNDPLDDAGHGTHVTGIVAASDNNVGVVGVAPGTRVYALKVLDRRGNGNFSAVIAALDWIWANPQLNIRVTNNSYGGSTDPGASVKAAFDKLAAGDATHPPVLHIGSAGNTGTTDVNAYNVGYPARYPSVVAVANTDTSDARYASSSTGPAVELSAPGTNVNSTSKSGGYELKTGSSMAAPHVAGLAALIFTRYPQATPDAVRRQLQATAKDLGAVGRDSIFGYGRVQAVEAVAPSALTTILPLDGTRVTPGSSVTLSVSHTNALPANATWTWTSSLTGSLGTGPSITATLATGTHAITATATVPGATETDPPTIVASSVSTLRVQGPTLVVTVSTNKAEYVNGESATITVRVRDQDDAPVSGASVTTVVTRAIGTQASPANTTTNTSGVTTIGYAVKTSIGGSGTYRVDSTASKTGYASGSGSTTFLVK